LTLTLTPPGGRRWLFTVVVNPYTSGGIQAVAYQLLAGATPLHEWGLPGEAMAVGGAHSVTLTHTQILTALGSTVFKLQMKAAAANTTVNSFGSASFIRQLIIQDVGSV
jgi:hypothetical protein